MKIESNDLRQTVRASERENRQRFDNISRVFKVFSDALHIAPPYFTVSKQSKMGMSASSASRATPVPLPVSLGSARASSAMAKVSNLYTPLAEDAKKA